MEPYLGKIERLKYEVAQCGLSGTWTHDGQHGRATFTTALRQILNWWPKKGTLQIQGLLQDELRAALTGGRFRAAVVK